MMGTGMGAWILVLIFLGLAVAVTGGVLVAGALGTRRKPGSSPIGQAESQAVREAKDALRLRYANGEISREEYLQGKVELED
jgi:putative membrane protein